MSLNIVVLLSLAAVCVLADKVYERCELAKALMDMGADRNDAGIWVCIAFKESSYRTNVVGPEATGTNDDKSNDYGIFQINNRYWCTPEGKGCGIACADLLNDDITDDFTCAKLVKDQSANGFEAWTTYKPSCADPGTNEEYLKDCGL